MAYGGSGAAAMAGNIPMAGTMTNPMTTGTATTALPAMEATKPACGTTGPKTEYDLTIHVVGLFLVLLSSCFGAGFPVVAKKVKWLKIPPRVFFFCKHFGTGVLIATAFVHLLPTAFQSLGDPCLPDLFTKNYTAMPGVIGLGSLFTLFAIEMWLHTKMPHAHSHGSADGAEFAGGALPPPPPVPRAPAQALAGGAYSRDEKYMEETWPVDEKKGINEEMRELDFTEIEPRSEMPAWFVVFYEQYVRQREEMVSAIRRFAPRLPAYAKNDNSVADRSFFDADEASLPPGESSNDYGVVDLEHGEVDPMVYKKMSLDITLLEGGILFHSVFVGMTVSITTDGFIVLLIAILFHQTFEGLGLGSRIAQVPYPKGSIKPWLLVFAFGTTAPIGQAIGLVTHNSYDPNSAFALILVGTFNAISSGLLIYAALVDLLYADFLSEEADRALTNKKKILAFVYVLLGAAGMSFVGAFA